MDLELKTQFCAARRAVIAEAYAHLNPEQIKAVLATEGPLLLLAGAGSGKTTVLINRVANLMKYGRGSDSDEVPASITDEQAAQLIHYSQRAEKIQDPTMEMLCKLDPAPPWTILAITFTNKAAGELKERLERMLGPAAADVWAATFHATCVRILRRDIERLGFPKSFTIYDSDDAKRVVKDILKEKGVDEKSYPPRAVLAEISSAKDEGLLAADYAHRAGREGSHRRLRIAELYSAYEKRLWDAGALDFDDLILHTVRLLDGHPEVRAFYQNKFRYVLVDEYQDTNRLQYRLTTLLSGGRKNLCVVGDDDQSIYRFRGATIENILSFEAQYKAARVIRLEQNYRSTGHILQAANAVIANNQGRKGKNLWTNAAAGDLIRLHTAMNEHDEAQFVASEMIDGYQSGRRWKDFAILYRMNAQSNQMEIALKRNGIPYRIIGGTRFFDRAEVKDMLAYLCVIQNPADDLRLLRIINTPSRKLGQTTVESARRIAEEEGAPLYAVLCRAARYPALGKAAAKLGSFVALIEGLRKLASEAALDDFYEEVVARTGYAVMLEERNTLEDRTRLENVQELLTSVRDYINRCEETPTLAGFLDEISLYTDLDNHDPAEDSVVMMTMHAAKGLEFPVVFVVGAEDGLFPSKRVIGEPAEMEEERRLCYVAMTRAKERLYMTGACQRMLFGQTASARPSRFLGEIPEAAAERSGRTFGQEYGEVSFDRPAAGRSFDRDVDRAPDRAAWSPRPGGGHSAGAPAPRPPRPTRARQRVAAVPLPPFGQGDTVEHKAFGRGLILSIQPMGGDALVEIAFESSGTKRLMLRSTAQHMKKV